MADLDHIGVSSSFDPSGFAAGLAQATAEFQTFLQRTGTLSAPVVVNLKLSGITEAVQAMESQVRALPPVNVPVTVDAVRALAVLEEVQAAANLLKASGPIALTVGTTGAGLSPAVFTEFGDAALASLGKIEVAMTQLGASLQPLTTAFNNFFTGVIQGASQEAAAIERSALRQRAAFAGVGTVNVNSAAFRAIQADLNALNRALDKGTVSAEDQAVAIADLRARYAELQSGVAPTVQSVGGLNTTVEKSGGIFGGAARSGLTLRSSLVVLASQATGTSTTFGRLLESVLLFSGGTAAVVAVAGPLLAVAVAYELLTKNVREARKATDDFIKAQVDAARAADAVGKVREAFAGVDEPGGRKIEGLTTRMERLNKTLADARVLQEQFNSSALPSERPLDAGIAQVQQKVKDLVTATREAGLAFLDPILSAQRSASDRATSDALAITQQGITLRLDAIKAGFADELITREQFFAASRAQAGRAATADRAALQAEMDRAQTARDHAATRDATGQLTNPAGFAAAQAQVDSLTSQITLRQALLTLTRQQSDELERQTKLNLLIKAGIGTVGGIEGLQPPVLADQKIALKPRIDLSEVEAQVAKFVTETAKIDLDNRFEDARLNGIALAAVLATINLRLKDIGNANVNAKPILTSAESLQRTVRGISDISTAFGQAGVAVGLFGQDTQRVFDGIASAAQDTGRLIADIASGNVLGAIASGLNVIGDIGNLLGGGKSVDQRAAEQALNANTDAIRANTVQRSTGFTGIGGAQDVAAIIRQELAGQGGKLANLTQEGGDLGRFARNTLVSDLAATGLSFVDLQRIAKEFGITILENGKLVGKSLTQLATEIDAATAAASHFSKSFTDQLDFFDLKARINAPVGGGPSAPTSQFQRDLDAAGAAGSNFVQHFFDGALGSREAFQKRLNEFLDLFGPNSTFFKDHPGILGGLTPEDWKKILNDGASAMDLFNQAVTDATRRMGDFNLPQGFRRAALAFETGATGPPPGPTLPSGPPLRRTDVNPRVPDQLPSFVAAVTVQPGAIVIQQLPGESMTELADRVVTSLHEKALTQSGDTLHYWGLN